MRLPLHGLDVLQFLVCHADRDFLSPVRSLVFELQVVPVRVGKTEIHYSYVCPYSECLLQIPKREGVIVAVGEKYGVRFARLQDIV